MNTNDVVKFKRSIDPGDASLLMKVLEMRGDLVLVENLMGLPINPTSVFHIDELKETGYQVVPARLTGIGWIAIQKNGRHVSTFRDETPAVSFIINELIREEER